jgi:hypothetical protein
MKKTLFKLSLIVVLLLTLGIRGNCQSVSANFPPIPDDYKKGTIPQQINMVETHTRIYEGFRAIREDLYQLINRNIRDTLAGMQKRINSTGLEISNLKSRIDSLNKNLEATKSSLNEMERTKNSLSVLGLEINKTAYNSVMWTILCIAALLLIIGFLIFRKNSNLTIKAKTELADLQKEFESYKQKKRVEQENMTMAHFNEIKKLRDSR